MGPLQIGTSCVSVVILVVWILLIVKFWGLRGKIAAAQG